MPQNPKVIPILRGRLVLVAERYGTPRVLVTSAIQSLGYRAKAFSTGADTLAFLKLQPGGVQCLLADLGLPDMDGGELIERARDLVPGLRVVLMAAPDDPSEEPLLRASGPSVPRLSNARAAAGETLSDERSLRSPGGIRGGFGRRGNDNG
jgi:CheY-like chemotaxis protein